MFSFLWFLILYFVPFCLVELAIMVMHAKLVHGA